MFTEMYDKIKDLEPEERKLIESEIKNKIRIKIQKMRKWTLMPSDWDAMKLKKKCFYYTKASDNNKMTQSEMLEARNRYFEYAGKYLR